jgi:hypothetical protein
MRVGKRARHLSYNYVPVGLKQEPDNSIFLAKPRSERACAAGSLIVARRRDDF